jgi:hypothetical protein
MLNNTLKLILVLFIYFTGLIFSLILLYASPDNMAHSFEASLFFCSSILVLFGLSYNLSFKEESNNFMQYLYVLVFIQVILSAIILALISKYAHPMQDVVDITAMYIFSFSGVLMMVGLFKILLKNKGEKNA